MVDVEMRCESRISLIKGDASDGTYGHAMLFLDLTETFHGL